MKTYKYTDATNTVVHVIDDDGKSRSSQLASTLPQGVDISPADLPAWSREPLLRIARAGREIALNRLAGIAFAANHFGDAPTVTACLAARAALLDITKLPAVLAATDDASLTAAVTAGYAAIVAAAPTNVRSAFSDIQS